MLLKNARILYEDKFTENDLRISGGMIDEVGSLVQADGEEVIDLKGKTVIPGLVETHFHGAMGYDSTLGTQEAFEMFSEFMASNGITTFVPALISSPDDVTERYIKSGLEFIESEAPGAQMAGLYLEGPFLSKQYKGAHDPDVLQEPSVEKFKKWQEMAHGKILKMVVAPELPGAQELISYASQNGVTVEIGHTGATHEQAVKGIEWGARLVTHLYNAMPPLHHREPAVIGAVLTDDRVTCELICDMGHVAPAAVKVACRAKGYDRINVISDSFSAAGLEDGEYTHTDGRNIIVKNGLAYLENGTLMGSTSTVLDGVHNLINIGIPAEMAIKMASANPAKTLGLTDRGVIEVGKRADLTVLDDNFNVNRTYVGGKVVYKIGE